MRIIQLPELDTKLTLIMNYTALEPYQVILVIQYMYTWNTREAFNLCLVLCAEDYTTYLWIITF